MCGEKMSNFSRCSFIMGSPPHVRGKGCASSRRACTARITPAYAGKRACCWGHPAAWGDHPRTCGEKRRIANDALFAQGSPPHMRGKVVRFEFDRFSTGITPAHAGKSLPGSTRAACMWDHPRTCGEKLLLLLLLLLLRGSPPHMRGKVKRHSKGRQCGGITPAHAGKSARHRHF